MTRCFVGALRWVAFIAALSWGAESVVAEKPSSEYDQIFQKGLVAEAGKNWTEAVQYYLQAQEKAPTSPWPKERIIAIFKNLNEQGQSTLAIEVLLPSAMQDEFKARGFIRTSYDQESVLKKFNQLIWGGLISLLLLAGIFLTVALFRKRNVDRVELVKVAKPKKVLDLKDKKAVPSEPQKKEVTITEKTREEMSDLIGNVKSVTREFKISKEQKVDIEGLRDSGVIDALSEDWVSKVSSEDSPEGKFSKMMVSAELIFEEEEEKKGSSI